MNNKFLFSIGTLLFNQLGVPYFLVKNSKQGLKTFVYGIITFGIVAIINTIKGILGGIKLFKMSAEDFAAADKVALINALPGDMNYKELIAAGKARLSKKKKTEGESDASEETTEESPSYEAASAAEEAYAAEETTYAAEETAYVEPTYTEPTYTEAAYTEAATYEAPNENTVADEVHEAELVEEEEPKKKKNIVGKIFGALSFILGLISLIIGLTCACTCGALPAIFAVGFTGIGAFFFGIISLIASAVSRRFSVLGLLGIMLPGVSIVISLIFGILLSGVSSIILAALKESGLLDSYYYYY